VACSEELPVSDDVEGGPFLVSEKERNLEKSSTSQRGAQGHWRRNGRNVAVAAKKSFRGVFVLE
jgi:hypothetical protein